MALTSPSSLLNYEEYINNWENLCDNFYTENNELIGSVISLVEFAIRSDGEVKINWAIIDKINDGSAAKITQLLAQIGFINDVMVYPEYYESYLATKRKVRSDWHKKKAAELLQEFDRLLHSTIAQYTPLHRRSELQTFLNQYKSSVGASPFIKGLWRTLQLQVNHENLVSWTFLDDIFTQNEPDFMRASVNLLINVLGFTHTIQVADESGQQASLRTWYLNNTLSDHEIKSLVKLFPKDNITDNVRATGTIDLSSQLRSSEAVNNSKSTIAHLISLPIKIVTFCLNTLRSCVNFCFGIFSWRKKNEFQT
ncbi:10276_t:CDS:2 [Ambispora gerdemannii]|uniref:10276_t:CDS:1 n=1 Tax=Ambispora gerdemannii TaxID=144530 RepID=A0A9N8YPJ2_9GLOM|nr:10276_t:CDS:2 [Ambispora gerdemannii]